MSAKLSARVHKYGDVTVIANTSTELLYEVDQEMTEIRNSLLRISLVLVLVLILIPGSRSAAAPVTPGAGDEQIAALDVQIDGYEKRIKTCSGHGYDRQKRYWDLCREIASEDREILTLQKEVSASQQVNAVVPEDLTRRIEEIRKRQNSRQLDDTQAVQAQAAWDKVDTILKAVRPDYSWHQVKVNLLRNLVRRARRVRFYLQEAMQPVGSGQKKGTLAKTETRRRLRALLIKGDAATYPLGPLPELQGDFPFAVDLDKLAEENRQWEEEYGECYFSRLEQPLTGRGEQAGDLAGQAEQLAGKLVELNNRRETLTSQVLGFLNDFDKDAKFGSLGIPYRKQDVKVAPDGTPSELLFCGGGIGGNDLVYDPLCFDVIDMYLYGFAFSMKERGVLNLEGLRKSVTHSVRGVSDKVNMGYYWKLPLLIEMGTLPFALVNPKIIGKDQDKSLYLRDYGGNYGGYVNIWHPEIRRLLQDNLTAVANYIKAKEIPNFLFYDRLIWEPVGLIGGGSDTGITEGGYNPEAITAFRLCLKEKFHKINILNKAWRTQYPDFAAIEPPSDPYVTHTPRTRATPLTYEWEVFRRDSYSDYLKLAVDTLQKADPDHPVAVEIDTMHNSFVNATAGAYKRIIDIPAQYIEDHYNPYPGHYPSLNLLYSLCLYAGKIPIETEYIWNFPQLIPPKTEDDYRVTGELSIWRKAVWGRKILHVFGDFDGWGYQHNFFDERFCQLGVSLGPTGDFVREAATAIPVGKKQAREFWPYLSRTEVVKPKIAILVPATSDINAYPARTRSDWPYPGSGHDAFKFSQFFDNWRWQQETVPESEFVPLDMDFRYVPEEVIVNGKEDLTGFKVMILPHATYFPDGLAEKLLKWTKDGGTLIAFGVPGAYDPYGFDDPVLMSRIFGSRLSYSRAADYNASMGWDLETAPEAEGIKVMQSDGPERDIVGSTTGNLALSGTAGSDGVLIPGNAHSSENTVNNGDVTDATGAFLSDSDTGTGTRVYITWTKPKSMNKIVVYHSSSPGTIGELNITADFQIQTLVKGGDATKDDDWITRDARVDNRKVVTSHRFPRVITQGVRIFVTRANRVYKLNHITDPYPGSSDTAIVEMQAYDEPADEAPVTEHVDIYGGSYDPDGGPITSVSTEYGQGVFILRSAPLDITKDSQRLQAYLERAIGWPTASSVSRSFEMVTREDKSGQRYLFIINPSLRDVAAEFVTVDGEYRQIIDLGIGSHCDVPLASRTPLAANGEPVSSLQGRTTFQMRLSPGEGTVLKLVK
jgi:hypothetical protein